MKCPYCNNEVTNTQDYCPNCGQAIKSASEKNSSTSSYWNSVGKEKSRDEKIRIDVERQITQNQNKKKRTTIAILVVLCIIGLGIFYATVIHPNQQYNTALSLMQEEKYDEARGIFESLGNYKTSEQELQKCNESFTQLKYENAVTLFENGDITTAMVEFHDLADYSDSERYYSICEIESINQAQINDKVTFGKFEGEDLRWIVLEKTDDKALLITESYIANMQLDANRYHDDYNDRWIYHFWSSSSLREWLNGEFLTSFTNTELERICEADLSTDEYETENYDGWGEEEIVVNTTDRVYIPTIEDVFAYSLYTDSVTGKRGWLRDRGHGIAFEYTLDEGGNIDSYWSDSEAWVRPMMSISLDGLEPVQLETSIDCYNEETPFGGKYWVIYRNGHQNERIEATSVDSTHVPEMLHAVLEDYELTLNDDDGADNWTGYILSETGEWIDDGYSWSLADKTKTIIASNLDVYDDEGNLILAKSRYSDIDWSTVN